MPKIYLKPNSPEFADDEMHRAQHDCDMPGCNAEANHKAPKDRSLNNYYWFCFEHIKEYNKAWDFFSGMSADDIEAHIIRSALWDRPTWKFENHKDLENELKHKAGQTYHFYDEKPDGTKERKKEYRQVDTNTPEYEAMAIMGLEPPLDFAMIRVKYKALVKKHHPDLNKGDKKSEALIKSINMAYTILKLAYEKFDKLEKD